MNNQIKISKYLSYVLRHNPDNIGIILDSDGWANINELIKKTKKFNLTKELLKMIVNTNDKQRFIIEDDKIRANQGHSINVNLNLIPIEPFDILYHGTTIDKIENIFKQGILSMNRQYVHLSNNEKLAINVAQRHGKPKVLKIDSKKMYEEGYEFYISKNGVWLTNYVPSKYII